VYWDCKSTRKLLIKNRDSYNLGWKLAGVIRKHLNPAIIATFEAERRPIAEQLVEVDQTYLQLFDAPKGQEPAWLLERAAQMEPFLMGLSVHYDKSPLTACSLQAPLDHTSDHIIPGKRFPEMTVSNHATAKSYPLQQLLKSNGRFHVIIFAADVSQSLELKRMDTVGAGLASIQQQFNVDFDVLAVHSASRSKVELASMHAIFFPENDVTGRDYSRVYCDLSITYQAAGIPPQGVIVAARPDQYIGWLGGLEDIAGLRDYFTFVFGV
jgi:phenol 2-monooxygenase